MNKKTNLTIKIILWVFVVFAVLAPPIYAQAQYLDPNPAAAPPDQEGLIYSSPNQAASNSNAPDSACGWAPWTWHICLAQGIVMIIGFAIKMVLVIAALILEVVLTLNMRIFETPAVVTGFSISLSLANLGFVLAIIVIAIMTILRQQSYGLKQTLWKLVVAALLVNFSLVIMKFIVGFSDQFTQYFMYAAGGGSIPDFVLKFGQAFSPQEVGGLVGGEVSSGAAGSGTLLDVIVSGFGSIIILIVIAITMWTFIMLMFVRYITIAFLAIIMPFAWLLWIFPDTKNNWKLWWSTFLRWTFFAPIVMFFIFLALTTWNSKSSFVKQGIVDTLNKDPNSASQALVEEGSLGFIKRFFESFADTIASQVLIIGLVMGGMHAANKLGIKGAEAAVKRMDGVAGAIGGYLGRRGRQAGTSLLRGERGQRTASRLQQVGAGWTGIFGRTAGKLATLPIRYAGRGMQVVGTAGGEKAVEAERARSKDMTMDQKIAALSTATAPQRIAWIEDIKNAGKLGDVQNIERYIGEGKEDEFKRYDKGTLYKEVRKESSLGLSELVDKGAAPEEIKKHVKSMSDMGRIAETLFISKEKIQERVDTGKDLAPGIRATETERLKEVQKALIRETLAEGSASNISTLLQKLSRADQLSTFDNIIVELKGEKDFKINESVLGWANSSAARALGDPLRRLLPKEGADKSNRQAGFTSKDIPPRPGGTTT